MDLGLNTVPHTLFQREQEIEEVKMITNRIFLDDFIHEGSDLHDILNTLHDAGPNDMLEVRLNSSGGFARYGQQFINVMRDKFKGRTITIVEAEALSIAALIFMAGDRRIIYPHSTILFHDVALSTEGKANEAISRLKVMHLIFIDYMHSLMSPFFSEAEINNISKGMDMSLDAEEMCRRGVAHTVLVNGEPLTAEEYLKSIGG